MSNLEADGRKAAELTCATPVSQEQETGATISISLPKTRKTVWPFDFGVNNVKACLISTNQAGSGGVMLWERLSWSTLASYSIVPKGSLAGRLKQLGIAPPTFCAQPTHY